MVSSTDKTWAHTGTGRSTTTFNPRCSKPFNLTITGTFVGTVQLERSFDGGTTWYPCSRDAVGSTASWTAPTSQVVWEPADGVLYATNCTAYTSGTITVLVGQ